MTENYFQTDEAQDVAGSVRHALRCASFTSEDPQAWKWLMLALHSALQGACVCHLTTTASPVGAVTDQNAEEWLVYFRNSRTDPDLLPPKTRLMALPDLLKAVRKPGSAGCGSQASEIKVNDQDLELLKRVHDFRNQFVHFEPLGWSIGVSGADKIARLVARIIDDIHRVGWAFRHLKDVQHNELCRDLRKLARIELPS